MKEQLEDSDSGNLTDNINKIACKKEDEFFGKLNINFCLVLSIVLSKSHKIKQK